MLPALKWAPGNPGSSVVAYPASITEEAVLDTLRSAGIESVIGSSTLRVPLSDFARITDIPVRNALGRAPPDDPRRTPLLDQLETRFVVRDPDGAPWNVLYIREGSSSTSASLSKAMDTLGIAYALTSMGEGGRTGYLWVPVLIWLAWLAFRKPRGDPLARISLAIPLLPLLNGATAESAILVLVLETAAVMAVPYLAGGMRGLLAARLAPLGIAAVGLVALDAGILPKLGISTGVILLLLAFEHGIKAFERRRWLHELPIFKPITKKGADSGHKSLIVSAMVSSAAILVLSLAMPVGEVGESGRGTGYSMVRGRAEEKSDGKAVLASHVSFQRALTYGRLGEAAWGESEYSDAYVYEYVDGRIRRVGSASRQGQADGENDTHGYKNLVYVLAEPPLLGISRK
jgi:hypothetical protein